MAAEAEVDCEWKQLIKVLLPGSRSIRGYRLTMALSLTLLLLGELSGVKGTLTGPGGSLKGRDSGRIYSSPSTTSTLASVTSATSSSTSSELADRADKVKAKWKENFWSQSVANLTLMESQKAELVTSTPTPSSSTSRTPPDFGISSRKMPPQSPGPTLATGSLGFFPLSPSDPLRSEGSILKEDLTLTLNQTLSGTRLSSNKNKKLGKNKKRSKKHRKKTPPTKFNLPKPSPTKSPPPLTTSSMSTLGQGSSSSTARAKSTGRPLPRTTLTADLSQYGQEYVLEYESSETDDTLNHTHSHPERVVSTPSPSRRRNKPKNKLKSSGNRDKTQTYYGVGSNPSKNKKVKNKRPKIRSKYGSTFGFPRNSSNSSSTTETNLKPIQIPEPEGDQEDLNRATLIADLAPYGQDAYLEYESNEIENIGIFSGNESSGNGTISLQFFPKNPVNLLNVLQVLAANMQPIKMASPLGGEAPSIPLRYNVNITNRVPVKMNSPSSPFLFSLDLDSFFTRMVISLFYSSVAIAPLVYLMMGGLGGLSGLSIVPFTGKRRRRRRRRRRASGNHDHGEDNFDFYGKETEFLDKTAFLDKFDKNVAR